MTGFCQRLLLVLSIALLGLQGAAANTAVYTGPPLIEIVGESGKQSETRTIRFQTTGTPKIRFEPQDLTRSSPASLPRALIDSGQIRFTPPAAPRADAEGSATFTIVIDTLPARYGEFTGNVSIIVNDKPAGTIKLQLNVQYPAAQPLATEPKTLSKSMAALHSFLPGSPIFSGRPAKGNFPITIPGLPDGIEVTAGSGDVTLISDGGKRLQGEAKLKHTKQGAMLEVDASDASAGKYTGSAELVIADGQRRLSFPVEISVRDNPWLVLLLILVGIVFGYAAKWVNERGSKIITAQNKIHEVEARREQLPPDFASWLEPTISDLIARFAIGRYDDVATLAGHADARIAFVERLVRLDDRANRIGDAAISRRIHAFEGRIRSLGTPESMNADVTAIETDLTAAETRNGAQDDSGSAPPAKTDWGRKFQAWKRSTTRGAWIAQKLQWLVRFVTVLLLAFVGFEAIYLNANAQTFGANPVTDYLSAILWGLSAEVAARTLLTLGRVAPAR